MLLLLAIPIGTIGIVVYCITHGLSFSQFVESFENTFWSAQPWLIGAIVLAAIFRVIWTYLNRKRDPS